MTLKSTFDKVLGEKIELPEELGACVGSAGKVTLRQAIVYSIISKAMKGDLQAAAFIRDIGGEKTAQAAKPIEQTLTVRLTE